MKKIVRKRKYRRKVKKYSSIITKYYTLLILITAIFSSAVTFLMLYSKTTSEKVLAQYSQTIQQYPENNYVPQDNPEVIYHGNRTMKKIALTFDADMTPWMKQQILDKNVASSYNKNLIVYLEKSQTKATLFLTGMWIELYPDVAKELADNPLFELGNHSYSHPSFQGFCFGLTQLKETDAVNEIGITQKLLRDLTETDNTLFRFPGGCINSQDVDLVKQAGMKVIHWDVAGEDGFNNNIQNIENNVLSAVQNGSIIVLHMNGYPTAPRTAEAAENIIPELKKRGFEFVKVSELLSAMEQSNN